MNQLHNSLPEDASDSSLTTVKEPYHAPKMKIHGKLERLTLQSTSLGGGGTGDPPTEPEGN